MTTAADHRGPRVGPAWLLSRVSFAIMVAGWLAFFAALIASPQTLEAVWNAVRDLPVPLEGVAWVLAFPFLAGLAIWQATFGEPVRLIAIAVLAAAFTYMFVPRERKQ